MDLSPYAEELFAMNKEVLGATGIKSLAADMGISFSTVLKTDAVAALGIVNRRGIGKMSRISTQELWMHNAIWNQVIEVLKIDGEKHRFEHTHKEVHGGVLKKHTVAMK